MARELLNIATEGESEAVKLNAVRDALDRAGLGAKAEVSLEGKPWERLLGDIAGIATISRAEHHARQGLPPDDQPTTALVIEDTELEVVDAEIAEVAAEGALDRSADKSCAS